MINIQIWHVTHELVEKGHWIVSWLVENKLLHELTVGNGEMLLYDGKIHSLVVMEIYHFKIIQINY